MATDNITFVSYILSQAVAELPRLDARRWTEEETQFLIDNYPVMTEAEIAEKLGRSLTSIHLRRKRDLNLPPSSKNPDVITANRASVLLGIDAHKITCWVDAGLIKRLYRPDAPTLRIIKRSDLTAWFVNPKNWIYFDIHNIKDDHLRRLCELRSMRWGDEWWTTPQVARYHGVDVGEVKRYIKLKFLPGTHIPVSFGGRHPNGKWSYWRVLRSDAMQVHFYRGHYALMDRKWTAAADTWLLKAVEELHIEKAVIARLMKKPACSIYKRYQQLKERGK
jgi:hypothetical protein